MSLYPGLYRAAPIELLEPRRLFSADVGRLAIWADPGVVDPNSIPPDEAIVEDVFVGDEGEWVDDSGDGDWEEFIFIDPMPADGEWLIDPAICYFGVPDAGWEEFSLDGETSEELIDPAVCYVADGEVVDDVVDTTVIRTLDEPKAFDGEVLYAVDPAVCYVAGDDVGIVDESVESPAEVIDDEVYTFDLTLVDPAVCFPAICGFGETPIEVIDDGAIEEPVEVVDTPADEQVLEVTSVAEELMYTSFLPVEAPAAPESSVDAALPFVQSANGYEGIDADEDGVADLVFSEEDALA